MKLQSVHIREDFLNDKKYTATIEVKGSNGSTQLNLTEEQTQRIMRAVGDELIESTRQTAELLMKETIEGINDNQLEHQTPNPNEKDDDLPF